MLLLPHHMGAACCLQRICLHFWRVDAVVQELYHGSAIHFNAALAFLLVSMCCDTAQAKEVFRHVISITLLEKNAHFKPLHTCKPLVKSNLQNQSIHKTKHIYIHKHQTQIVEELVLSALPWLKKNLQVSLRLGYTSIINHSV